MLVAFSVAPSGGGSDSVGDVVAEAVRVVRESGLPCETTSMFTTIEAPTWDEAMAVVKRAVEAVADRAPRVSLVLKADIRPGWSGQLQAKVERVERALAEPAAGSRTPAAGRRPRLTPGGGRDRAGPGVVTEHGKGPPDTAGAGPDRSRPCRRHVEACRRVGSLRTRAWRCFRVKKKIPIRMAATPRAMAILPFFAAVGCLTAIAPIVTANRTDDPAEDRHGAHQEPDHPDDQRGLPGGRLLLARRLLARVLEEAVGDGVLLVHQSPYFFGCGASRGQCLRRACGAVTPDRGRAPRIRCNEAPPPRGSPPDR